MENNIQNELQDEAIQDSQHYKNQVDPLEDEGQQTEAFQDDEDELDLGDADGSGGELESEVDDLED